MLDDEIVGAPATSDKDVVGGHGRGVVVGNSLELDDEGATRVVGWRGHGSEGAGANMNDMTSAVLCDKGVVGGER
jgi:hypothetical protein